MFIFSKNQFINSPFQIKGNSLRTFLQTIKNGKTQGASASSLEALQYSECEYFLILLQKTCRLILETSNCDVHI